MPLKKYLVRAEFRSHGNVGLRHFRVSADSPGSARAKVQAKPGTVKVLRVMRF